jgi:osmotically-inducible protein OsmY
MPNRPPRSYEDIVRATVPDPDTSWRPTTAEERRAYEGYRALSPQEQQLHDRVHDALLAAGIDTMPLEIGIDRDRVILRGQVREHQLLDRIPDIVRRVEGVGTVIDQLVIAA